LSSEGCSVGYSLNTTQKSVPRKRSCAGYDSY